MKLDSEKAQCISVKDMSFEHYDQFVSLSVVHPILRVFSAFSVSGYSMICTAKQKNRSTQGQHNYFYSCTHQFIYR